MYKKKEKIIRWVFTVLAFSSLLFLVGIMVTLFASGLPAFQEVGLFEFILGKEWYPTYDPPDFGILPLILASFLVTIGAVLVCVPLGVGSALFVNELASYKQKAILKPIIEILAGVPSIVYGFFGMVIVAPYLQRILNIPIGQTAFTGSLMLGIMATPTVCSFRRCTEFCA